EFGLVGSHHLERRTAELAHELAELGLRRRRGEIVHDLGLDAALLEQGQRGARLATARVVVDFGFHFRKCKVSALRREPWRRLDALGRAAYGTDARSLQHKNYKMFRVVV